MYEILISCIFVIIVLLHSKVADEFVWYMVKPHNELQIMLADVVAMVVDVMTTQDVCAIWLMLKQIVVDAISTGQHLF